MINSFFAYSYNYYQMYYYVLLIVFTIMLMWKKSKIKSIIQQSVIYSIVFVLAFGAAAIVKEQNIFKDMVEIRVDHENGARCALNGISYGVFKTSYDLDLEQGVNVVKIPIGMDRVMKVTSFGECRIAVKAGSDENSYLLENKGAEIEHDIAVYFNTRKLYLIGEMLIKAALIVFLTFLTGIVVSTVIQFILDGKIGKVKYELIIFGFLIAQLILFIPSKIDEWVAAWYVLNYKDGAGSRLLVGSLLNLICSDYVTAGVAYHFAVVSLVILCFLVSILFGQVIRKSQGAKSMIYYTAFYLACPGSVAYLWYNKVGKLETYSLILCLVCVILFEKVKNSYVKYTITAVTFCLVLLIHQGTLFLYCPILMTLILYDLAKAFDIKKFILSLTYGGGVYYCSYICSYFRDCIIQHVTKPSNKFQPGQICS